MITNKKILQHFFHPHNVGSIDTLASGVAGASGHGNMVQLQLDIEPKTQRIKQAYFKAYSCPYTIAACSLLTQELENKTLAEAKKIEATLLDRALQLPEHKLSSAILTIKALKNAISNYEASNEQI